MIDERTARTKIQATALGKFWAHVEICVECSPEGACSDCKTLLQAVTAEAKIIAASTPNYCCTPAVGAGNEQSLRSVSDAQLMREHDEVSRATGGNDVRRDAVISEINRRARLMQVD